MTLPITSNEAQPITLHPVIADEQTTRQQHPTQKQQPTPQPQPKQREQQRPSLKSQQRQQQQQRAIIPGSRLGSQAALRTFQKRFECLSSRGQWVVDARPRLLPWMAADRWGGWQCDVEWVRGEEAETAGRVAHDTADQVVLQGRPAAEWRVREAAKYTWRTHSECGQWGEMDARALSSKLSGRRVLLVGDSLSATTFFSLRNHLLQQKDGLPGGVQDNDNPDFCAGRADHPKIASRPRLLACGEVRAGNASFVYIRDDALRTAAEPLVQFPGLVSLPWFDLVQAESTRPDVIVLNRGAHFKETAAFTAELQTTLNQLRGAAPHLLIVYRSTPPGHAHCARLHKPLSKRQNPAKLPFHWGDFAAQNNVARRLVKQVGGVWLDVDPMTALRPDGHLSPPKDCLHYCLPGPPDEWTRMLYHMIVELM